MKNKYIILFLITLTILTTISTIYFFKKYKNADDLNSPFIVNQKSVNFDKILTNKDASYLETSDPNTKGLIERYLRTDFIGNKRILGDQRFEDARVYFYNDFLFLGGKASFKGVSLSVYVTNQELKSECNILSIENIIFSKNTIVSGYPQQEDINSKIGFCVFDKLSPLSLKYFDLSDKINKNETLIKGSELYHNIYSYRIDEEKREIIAQVFDKNKKDEFGYGKYVRDVVVKY